ncbi:hypothetical protein [Fibrobacter sp. UWB7]|uniref:hypothetical protein n=1 Tax=Fibrobacter sp. UWB7 TaxID=1896206 RepID=UPI00091B40C4|nr:hypothetical protein [Fibrobacter sp. UWB7]SHM83704.1 hypothetical protein SAMN05720467_2479 [Fibrobacter sp. UWB7]
MKKIVMASAVMAATAMAGEIDSRPEASVPTPVEARETLDKAPKMSEKENVDWQKMREERRIAREQILKDLRNNSAAEKKEMPSVAAKPAIPEKPHEKNMEKPKDELVREKKLDEKEQPKEPQGVMNPFGPGRMEPMRPFGPRPIERNPWEKQNPHEWEKGPFPKK